MVSEPVKPLAARSVLLSLMLGAHPRPMTSADLTRAGEYFEIGPSTMRVALTRAVAAGDVHREGAATYTLGERLLARQARQAEAISDAETDWDGSWEMAVVVVTGRSSADRAALRERLTDARLAELREGVWMRPANLPCNHAASPVLEMFKVQPQTGAADLARRLWDLDERAKEGRRLLQEFGATVAPSERLAVAAHLVRHLASDPLLPAALLPRDWPGSQLRETYASYQAELQELALQDLAMATPGDRSAAIT